MTLLCKNVNKESTNLIYSYHMRITYFSVVIGKLINMTKDIIYNRTVK